MTRVSVDIPVGLKSEKGKARDAMLAMREEMQKEANRGIQLVLNPPKDKDKQAFLKDIQQIIVRTKEIVRIGRKQFEVKGAGIQGVEEVTTGKGKKQKTTKVASDPDFIFNVKEVRRTAQQEYVDLMEKLKLLTKEDKFAALEELLKTPPGGKSKASKTFENPELAKLRAMKRDLGDFLERKNFRTELKRYRDLVEEIATKSVQDQISILRSISPRSYPQILAKARNKIRQLQRGPSTGEFSEFKSSIADLPIGAQINQLLAYELSGRPKGELARRFRKKLEFKEKKQEFSKLEETINTYTSTLDKIAEYENYINKGGFFSNKAVKKLNQLRNAMSGGNLKRFTTRIRGLSIEDQIDAWEQFAKSNAQFTDLARANQRVLRGRLDKQKEAKTKNDFRSQINQWKALDQPEALKQLENYISAGLGSRDEIAKATRERNRIQRNLKINAENDKRARQRAFASNMLAMGGVGIGLFGAAGFPLLNVGFAAMSGGIHVGIAAGIATALGESIRAIEAFRQATLSAAKEIGLVGVGFKITEARFKASDAILGIPSMASDRVGMERRLKLWEEQIGAGSSAFKTWTDSINTFKEIRDKAFLNFSKDPAGALYRGATMPFRGLAELRDQAKSIKDIYTTFGAISEASKKQLPIELNEAYRALMSQMSRGGPGVESDPYQAWLRIQNSAFDANKSEEHRIQVEMLKYIKELRDKVVDSLVKAENNSTSNPFKDRGSLPYQVTPSVIMLP